MSGGWHSTLTHEQVATTSKVADAISASVPEHDFPGLKPGDRWCLCVQRWIEALQAGCAPKVDLSATHVSALDWVDLETLRANAVE